MRPQETAAEERRRRLKASTAPIARPETAPSSRRRSGSRGEDADAAPPPLKLFVDDQLYSAQQIADKVGIHRVTPWRWVKQGRLCKPRKISANTTRWLGRELNSYLDNADTGTD